MAGISLKARRSRADEAVYSSIIFCVYSQACLAEYNLSLQVIRNMHVSGVRLDTTYAYDIDVSELLDSEENLCH